VEGGPQEKEREKNYVLLMFSTVEKNDSEGKKKAVGGEGGVGRGVLAGGRISTKRG